MNQVIVSDLNRTPVVQIVTWLCLVISVLAFFTHAGIKIYTSRALSLETILGALALVFCAAQSVTVSLQTTHGYGKPSNTLSNEQINAALKGEYAATILFLISLGLSKSAIIAFINGLTPKKSDQHLNYLVGVLAGLWTISAVFASAFQCKLPQPWNLASNDCIDRRAWWYAVTSLNIFSDITIIALEIKIITPLRIPRERKASIIILFACRLLVSAALAVQLYFFKSNSEGERKDDFTLGYWESAICNQIVQCLSIVTISLPYAKMFMESFESGLIRVDDLRRRGEHTTGDDSGKGYKLLDVSRGTKENVNSIKRTNTVTVETTMG